MRVNNKGGVTPRDRRLDRRIVAVAAMAAILLCATTGQAANTLFTINTALSSATVNVQLDLGPGFIDGPHQYIFSSVIDSEGDQFGGSPPANTNVNNLISGSFTGTTFGVANTPGSALQLDAGANIQLGDIGSFWPTGGGFSSTPAQYGFDSADFLADPATTVAWAAIRGLTYDLSTVNTNTNSLTVDGGPLLTYAGPSTYYDTNGVDTILSLVAATGAFDILLPIAPFLEDASGLPVIVSPDGGATPVVSWDGTTLVLPYDFAFSSYDGDLDATFSVSVSGQIVSTAAPVPEPSSVMLLSFGAVGLLGYFWRARKRRA